MHHEDDGEDTNPCPLCRGPLIVLGDLGSVRHYRCRNCGAEISDRPKSHAVRRVPKKAPKQAASTQSMTPAEARAAIPEGQIRYVVDKYNVGTDPEVVAEKIRKLAVKAKFPPAAVTAAVAYAKRRHAQNLKDYRTIVGGRIGANKKR